MLKITLYKECILSHEYSEVFHHTVFSGYLQDLVKRQLPDLDLVYYEKEGTLIFDYELEEDNIYEYNYMKVEVYDDSDEHLPMLKFTRYCFISNIRIQNELCYVDYEEDRWQSYSSRLKIRGSFLSRSRFLNYTNNNISIKNLPMEYDGHNPLYIERLYNYSDQYVVICQVQKYNSASLGESTQRTSFTTCLYNINKISGATGYTGTKIHSLDVALWVIKRAYEKTQIEIQWGDEHYYFQIGNITLIPYNLFNANNFLDNYFPEIPNGYTMEQISNMYDKANYIMLTSGQNYLMMPELKSSDMISLRGAKHQIYHWTIQNDYKNYSIGTMTNQFELVNNGLNNEIYLFVDMNEFNFDIYLEFDKKQIAITNDFVLNLPYSYLNGEELSQQKMARTMRNIRAVGNIIENVADIGLTIGTAGANKTLDLTKATAKNVIEGFEDWNRDARYNLVENKAKRSMLNTGKNIFSGITGLIEANAPVYSSSKGTFSYEDAILNAYAGICIKKIIPQNESYVNNMINEIGYITYQIGGDEFLNNYYNVNDNTSPTYNVLKFEFVKAYGKFPQDICDDLKSILLKGFKIRYTKNV